jgi:hypothetical protein
MSKRQGQRSPRDPESIEHLSAEIVQKDGEGAAAYAVRMLEMDRREKQRHGVPVISKKGFVRKCGKLRKDLERMQGGLRKGSALPINVEDPAFVEHMRQIGQRRQEEFEKGPMRWMASQFATAERARRDPEYKKDLKEHAIRGEVPPSRMVKPWKGRQGREVAKDAATTTKRKGQKQERAIELRRQGHTEIEIAKKLKCTERTVRRYLTGR